MRGSCAGHHPVGGLHGIRGRDRYVNEPFVQRRVDLSGRDRRAAAGDDEHRPGRRGCGGGRVGSVVWCNRVGRQQRSLDARRARHEQRTAFSPLQRVDRVADRREVGGRRRVEEHDAIAGERDGGQHRLRSLLHRRKIDERHGQIGLAREHEPQIGLLHRCHRMPAHRRVAIEPVGRAVEPRPREEITEGAPAAKMRGRNHQRRPSRGERSPSDLDRPPDAADRGRRIECRTDLVMEEPGPPRGEGGERGRQVRLHLHGRERAAQPREADGSWRDGQHHGRGDEQLRGNPRQRERLEHVGRAGEVIAVVGQFHRQGTSAGTGQRPIKLERLPQC